MAGTQSEAIPSHMLDQDIVFFNMNMVQHRGVLNKNHKAFGKLVYLVHDTPMNKAAT